MNLDVGLDEKRNPGDSAVADVGNGNCNKGNLCTLSESCNLYIEDYHCTFNRGVFLKEGMAHPSCYKPKPNGDGNGQV